MDEIKMDLSHTLQVMADQYILQLELEKPSFVYCAVEVYDKDNELLGIVSNVTRLVPFSLEGSLKSSYVPSVFSDMSIGGQQMLVTATFNQVINFCSIEMFEVSSFNIMDVRLIQNNLFSSSCVLRLESEMGGYKQLKLNPYVVESIAGSTNTYELEMNVVYEKSRPSLSLFDISEFSESYYKERRVIALFSRSVTDLHVLLVYRYHVDLRYQL